MKLIWIKDFSFYGDNIVVKKFSILMVIFQSVSVLVMGIMIYIFTQNNETIEKNIEDNIKQVIEWIGYT